MLPEEPLPDPLDKIAARLAWDGVPINVIARGIQFPSATVRENLAHALALGELTELPKADWPPTARRADRGPAFSQMAPQHNDELLLACRKTFRVTNLQASFLVMLLRHADCTKEKLHTVVENLRLVRRADRTIGEDETNPKMVDVIICHLRKKLRKHSIEIKTIWGHGYSLDAVARETVFSLLGHPWSGNSDTKEDTPGSGAGPGAPVSIN
jgi:DNA-binding winged helix-turn-helix (wHTH) protein